jgi:hypothetical protein
MTVVCRHDLALGAVILNVLAPGPKSETRCARSPQKQPSMSPWACPRAGCEFVALFVGRLLALILTIEYRIRS